MLAINNRLTIGVDHPWIAAQRESWLPHPNQNVRYDQRGKRIG